MEKRKNNEEIEHSQRFVSICLHTARNFIRVMAFDWSYIPHFMPDCLIKVFTLIFILAIFVYLLYPSDISHFSTASQYVFVHKLKFNQKSLVWGAKCICSISTTSYIHLCIQLKLIILFCILWCKWVMAFYWYIVLFLFLFKMNFAELFSELIYQNWIVERYHRRLMISSNVLKCDMFCIRSMDVWQSHVNSVGNNIFVYYYLSSADRIKFKTIFLFQAIAKIFETLFKLQNDTISYCQYERIHGKYDKTLFIWWVSISVYR